MKNRTKWLWLLAQRRRKKRAGGDAPEPSAYPRTATPATAKGIWGTHSQVMTSWGGPTSDTPQGHGGVLHTEWPGVTEIDFVPFGTAAQTWNGNGLLRTDPVYDFAIVSDLTLDFANGFPAPGSADFAERMQYLHWFDLEADQRGADVFLQQVWKPRDAPDALEDNLDVWFEAARQWRSQHTGKPQWMIPAGQYVRALRAEAFSVYSDEVHLSSQFARGVSYLVWGFLRHEQPTFVQPGDEVVAQIAWNTLLEWECAGMGGNRTVTVPPFTDPLPDPLPLPT